MDKGYKEFERSVEKMLGKDIRDNDQDATDMWSALANVDWYHPKKHYEVSYSFRSAGSFVADIRDKGECYMDWYCSGPYGQVSDKIEHALRKEGWIYDTVGAICDEPECIAPVSCGTPTPDGYRATCYNHKPKKDNEI